MRSKTGSTDLVPSRWQLLALVLFLGFALSAAAQPAFAVQTQKKCKGLSFEECIAQGCPKCSEEVGGGTIPCNGNDEDNCAQNACGTASPPAGYTCTWNISTVRVANPPPCSVKCTCTYTCVKDKETTSGGLEVPEVGPEVGMCIAPVPDSDESRRP